MAEPFPEMMTAFLAQTAIANFFKETCRHHVRDVVNSAKEYPYLALWSTDNDTESSAGDGRNQNAANYVLLLAKRIERHPTEDRTQHQDEVTAELSGLIKDAAISFRYKQNNFVAWAVAGNWVVDESEGIKEKKVVWIEMGLTIFYRPE